MAENGFQEKVRVQGEEIKLLRQRAHDMGGEIMAQRIETRDLKEDVHEIKDDVKGLRTETNAELEALRKDMKDRFDAFSGTVWRVAMFVVGAMGVGVAIVSQLSH